MSDPHHDPHGGGAAGAHPPDEKTHAHPEGDSLHAAAIPAGEDGGTLVFGVLSILVMLFIGGWLWRRYEIWPLNPPSARYEQRVQDEQWTVKSVLCPKVLITDGTHDRYVDFPPAGYGASSDRLRLSRNTRGARDDALTFCRKFIRPDWSGRNEPRRWTVRFERDEDGKETGNYEFFPPADDIEKVHGIEKPKEPPPPPPEPPKDPVPPPEPSTPPTVN